MPQPFTIAAPDERLDAIRRGLGECVWLLRCDGEGDTVEWAPCASEGRTTRSFAQ